MKVMFQLRPEEIKEINQKMYGGNGRGRDRTAYTKWSIID